MSNLDRDIAVTDNAITILHNNGWAQGTMITPDGRRCLVRALEHASYFGLSLRALHAVHRAIYGGAPDHHDSRSYVTSRLMQWNDTQGRHPDEVIEVLKLAREDLIAEKEERACLNLSS